MKLTISKKLKTILPDFTVSAYTFDLLEQNNENVLSEDITKAFYDIKRCIH